MHFLLEFGSFLMRFQPEFRFEILFDGTIIGVRCPCTVRLFSCVVASAYVAPSPSVLCTPGDTVVCIVVFVGVSIPFLHLTYYKEQLQVSRNVGCVVLFHLNGDVDPPTERITINQKEVFGSRKEILSAHPKKRE